MHRIDLIDFVKDQKHIVKKLKDIIVVLGGVRELAVPDKVTGVNPRYDRRRMKTKRTTRVRGEVVPEVNIKSTFLRLYQTEWKAAHTFVVNANRSIGEFSYKTPLGRLTLADKREDISKLREALMSEAAKRNTENRHWQVLVEGPTWGELNEDARTQLLTVMAGELPDVFFEEVEAAE